MKMDYNYHAHTARCGHATGTEEEYIQRAISCGIRRMGFSDHMPWIFSDGYESGYRVPVAEVGDYISTLRTLREKYRDRLELHIGFEMEYYPSQFPAMLEKAREYGAEYLILGQHYIGEEHPGGRHMGSPDADPERFEEYVDCVVAGIESGVFTYVAHPDIFIFTGDEVVYDRQVRRICEASKACNVPLEINFLGIRDDRYYPDDRFWVIAGQVGCPVTFGFDAHAPQDAYDGASLEAAGQMVEQFGLNYIGQPPLVPIRK